MVFALVDQRLRGITLGRDLPRFDLGVLNLGGVEGQAQCLYGGVSPRATATR